MSGSACSPIRLNPILRRLASTGTFPNRSKRNVRDEMMDAQQRVAFAWCESQQARRLDVMIDQPVAGESGVFVGRTFADAPDVDPVVYVTGDGLVEGDLVPCEIVASQGYDLVGAVVGKPIPRRAATCP